MPKLDAFGITDLGLARENNEDAWLIDPALSIAIVADGMGGAACGEIASGLTIETVAAYLRSPLEDLPPEQSIREAIREANRRVLDRARGEPGCEGMGSTIVAAFWNLPRVIIANVGDSRAYLWRGGALRQLSYDQTLVNELRKRLGLTQEQVDSYAHKNVLTMAVGTTEDVLIQTCEETLAPGDQMLLCSDGLHGPVGDQALAEILAEAGSLRDTLGKLVDRAKAAGGEDNITAVLLQYLD